MARSRSANTTKEKVIKQEPVIKSAGSGKDAHIKQAASKRRKMEINTPENESKSTARRRKNSRAVPAEAGKQMEFLNPWEFFLSIFWGEFEKKKKKLSLSLLQVHWDGVREQQNWVANNNWSFSTIKYIFYIKNASVFYSCEN